MDASRVQKQVPVISASATTTSFLVVSTVCHSSITALFLSLTNLISYLLTTKDYHTALNVFTDSSLTSQVIAKTVLRYYRSVKNALMPTHATIVRKVTMQHKESLTPSTIFLLLIAQRVLLKTVRNRTLQTLPDA